MEDVKAAISSQFRNIIEESFWEDMSDKAGKLFGGSDNSVDESLASAKSQMNDLIAKGQRIPADLQAKYESALSGAKDMYNNTRANFNDAVDSAKKSIMNAPTAISNAAQNGYHNVTANFNDAVDSAKNSIMNAAADAKADLISAKNSIMHTPTATEYARDLGHRINQGNLTNTLLVS